MSIKLTFENFHETCLFFREFSCENSLLRIFIRCASAIHSSGSDSKKQVRYSIYYCNHCRADFWEFAWAVPLPFIHVIGMLMGFIIYYVVLIVNPLPFIHAIGILKSHTRILMGFINYCVVLIVNPIGRILVGWIFFRNTLEILCHPICNWLL